MQLSNSQISQVYRRVCRQQGLVSSDDTALIFYDLSLLERRVRVLIDRFPKGTLHAAAIKANPLIGVLNGVVEMGMGLEAASLPELHIALKAGAPPERIVFDSPVKTRAELAFALELGCHINADSLEELARIDEVIDSTTDSTIGIRINPQVGTGSIASSSVAGTYSKFGVPLDENRSALIKAFQRYEWLTGVHVHVGSQGCPLTMLVAGVKSVLKFALETNSLLAQGSTDQRITVFDLGGGLPVAYGSMDHPPSMADYVSALRKECGALSQFRLITEFGRWLYANTGWVASKVEYVKQSGIQTVMIHVGADMFLRKCYRPGDWHHDLFILNATGHPKAGSLRASNVAGPLCFGGDFIAEGLLLPHVEEGDIVVIKDTGAYTLSMWSRYNSRQVPKVIGYREGGVQVLRGRESIETVIDFWR